MTKEVAIKQSSPFELTTYDEVERYANMIAKSDFAPKDYAGKPGNVIIAIQMGHELGLKPMQAIQNIAVVNGRPMVWGDAALALVRGNQECEYVKEWLEGTIKGGNAIAYCEVKRGKEIIKREFSVAQATQAQLIKKNVWAQYPERMLQMRARGYALRDSFPDVLKGVYIEGEIIEDAEFEVVTQKVESSSLGIQAVKQTIASQAKDPEPEIIEENIIDVDPETGEVTEPTQSTEEPMITVEEATKAIHAAKNLDDLNLAGDLVRSLSDAEKPDMWKIFYLRKRELVKAPGDKA